MTAIEELYHRYASDVYRFAFWLTGDRADAEDITSETFVRAWAGADGLRSATVKSYLLTIARNVHLQGWRRKKRQTSLDASLADTAPDPERSAADRDELRRVLDRLRQLPEIDRAALLMRAEGGLSYEEIAECLGLSVTAAKVRVHRARQRLMAAREP
jgi:RNA polymerase sigma-70 factor (ECF subfamily)